MFRFRSSREQATGLCRCGLLASPLLLLTVASLAAGAQLPQASPTGTTPQQAGAPRAPHHAQVVFADGLLTINASNASLNGLIREIAHQTGMKITGSVAEDRVFGAYGPADPQKILATLLDGTGSNILILSNAADAPMELVLTPRTGAATPPNPNTASDRDTDDEDQYAPPGAPTVINAPRARQPVVPGSTPAPAATNQIPAASETVTFPPISPTATPETGTTTPVDTGTPADSSSDTVKTPQQIFEQLQKLRQQTANPQPPR